MKKPLLIAVIANLITFAAYAVEVSLPNNAGKIDITDGVVTVAEGAKIADGEYKVTVDGKEVTVVFVGNKGALKE